MDLKLVSYKPVWDPRTNPEFVFEGKDDNFPWDSSSFVADEDSGNEKKIPGIVEFAKLSWLPVELTHVFVIQFLARIL